MLEFAADIGIPARQVELASAQEVQVHSPCADGTFSMVFNSKLLSYIYLNRADFEKRLAALEV